MGFKTYIEIKYITKTAQRMGRGTGDYCFKILTFYVKWYNTV